MSTSYGRRNKYREPVDYVQYLKTTNLKENWERTSSAGEECPLIHSWLGSLYAGTGRSWGVHEHEVRFSGIGGQGIILSGGELGRAAALYERSMWSKHRYMDGGEGWSIHECGYIDDEPILYPKVRDPDIYVIMSQQGFENMEEIHTQMQSCSLIQGLSMIGHRADG
jgi:hypothetical protein